MDIAEKYAFIRRVLAVFETADDYQSLFWRVEGDEVRLFVLCNDLFEWASADAEEVTTDNLPLLETTARELLALDTKIPRPRTIKDPMPMLYLADLFACRSRKMRPQKPYYAKLDAGMAELFDACGPERTDG